MNLAKSQELQIHYLKKFVKKRLYCLEKSLWLRIKYINIKQDPKLEYKYLIFFEIIEIVKSQAYKLELTSK